MSWTAALSALKTYAILGTAVALRSQSYLTGNGIDGDFIVTFEKDEADEKEQTLKFSASATDVNTRLPTWH